MALLEGRTAVITGGAQGLGLAIAQAFVAEGANVVLGDLNEEAVIEAAKSLDVGDRAIGMGCNVAELSQVDALVNKAVEVFGSLDVMVNNAGITRDATMRKMTEEQFDQVIAVHLRGTWNGLKSASAVMREQETGGSIINVSSISGKVGMLGQTNYSAAKAGIVGMTKAAAKEVGFKNVRVNAIQPGFINTAMTAAMRQDVIDSKLAEIPMGRAGEPSEVASVVLFLASDMSSYMTGTVQEIAGGRHL
jgi:3-oxoacyl-[acyl-carrier protein] reductase